MSDLRPLQVAWGQLINHFENSMNVAQVGLLLGFVQKG